MFIGVALETDGIPIDLDQAAAKQSDSLPSVSPRHIRALDGVRGIAVLLVLFFHSVQHFPLDGKISHFSLGWDHVRLVWS